MELFYGEVIEESLIDRQVLKGLKIVSTRISKVTPEHKTPWLTQWTLHKIEVTAQETEKTAEALSKVLDSSHGESWYIDFKSDRRHFIIYPEKVFNIDRTSLSQYQEARAYGLASGIPPHQVDFEENVVKAL